MCRAACTSAVLLGAVACTEGPEVAGTGEARPSPRVEAVDHTGPTETGPGATEAPDATAAGKPGASTTTASTSTSTTSTTPTTVSSTTTTADAATTSSTVAGPPAPDPATSGYAGGSVEFVNQRRSEGGLATLDVDPELEALADAWAREMLSRQELQHNPDLSEQMPSHYMAWGENVAYHSDPARIDAGWWDSDGHRANIMNSSYTHIGVAFVADDRGVHWAVQVFAG